MVPAYVVVSILEPHDDVIDRRSWPLHLTLLPEFGVLSSEMDVAERLRSVGECTGDFEVLGMQPAMFGGAGDVPVRVVSSSSVVDLHGRLLAELGDAIELVLPQFCGEGFVPHVTDQPHGRVDEGELVPIESMALVRLEGDRGAVVAEFPLSGREYELREAWLQHAALHDEEPDGMPPHQPDLMPILDENGVMVAWASSVPVVVEQEDDRDYDDCVYEPLPPMPVDEDGPEWALTIRAGDWQMVDGHMDNRISNDVDSYGTLKAVVRPNRIRQARWDCGFGEAKSDDDIITVLLRQPDRAYLIAELEPELERSLEWAAEGVLEFPDEPERTASALEAIRNA